MIDNKNMNTYFVSMKAIVSERGQITLPKAVRVSLGLKPGTVLDIAVQGSQFVGVKEEPSDPILRWMGRGSLPGDMDADSYLKEARE